MPTLIQNRWLAVMVVLDLAWNVFASRAESDFWATAVPRSVFQTIFDGFLGLLGLWSLKLVIQK